MASILDVAQALECYKGLDGADVVPVSGGLINETYAVRFSDRAYVLQRLNHIFDPAIHHNIRAVTERLAAAGVTTPQLIENRNGDLWTDLREIGVWRLMTFVEGTSFKRVQHPAQAEAAAALVARFHAAVDELDHSFVGMRLGVHDTAKHLHQLKEAALASVEHRFHSDVTRLAATIMSSAAVLQPLAALPARICHGDLKISNVLFDEGAPPESPRARCLIDLDTLGPMALAHELGDAWRSWCNPAGEDDPEAVTFDLEIFEAAWRGYAGALPRKLSAEERRALLHSVEWISLELAARFAADAVRESYFGWDPSRYGSAGEHNLTRARGQWALHEATLASRAPRAKILGLDAP